jgi:hypothetical protein
MRHSFEQVRQLASELSEDEQLILANSLLESQYERGNATDDEIAAAWDEEIARRVAEIKAGTASTCSLQDLDSDLRAIVDR